METSPRNIVKQKIDYILKFQAILLEIYAAAFVKDVGSTEASLYQLVQETSIDGLKTTWRFELRDGQ